jgi:hypothetical protein
MIPQDNSYPLWALPPVMHAFASYAAPYKSGFHFIPLCSSPFTACYLETRCGRRRCWKPLFPLLAAVPRLAGLFKLLIDPVEVGLATGIMTHKFPAQTLLDTPPLMDILVSPAPTNLCSTFTLTSLLTMISNATFIPAAIVCVFWYFVPIKVLHRMSVPVFNAAPAC